MDRPTQQGLFDTLVSFVQTLGMVKDYRIPNFRTQHSQKWIFSPSGNRVGREADEQRL